MKKGITFIEVVVVIAIIVALVALLVPAIQQIQQTTNSKNIKNIYTNDQYRCIKTYIIECAMIVDLQSKNDEIYTMQVNGTERIKLFAKFEANQWYQIESQGKLDDLPEIQKVEKISNPMR